MMSCLTLHLNPSHCHHQGSQSQAVLCRSVRYVYQKAYVEFFCSPQRFHSLQTRLKGAQSLTYMAVNARGELQSNIGPSEVNAVTWGVFPAKEVVQPTVVDPQSFTVWKVRRVLADQTMHSAQICLHGMMPGPSVSHR